MLAAHSDQWPEVVDFSGLWFTATLHTSELVYELFRIRAILYVYLLITSYITSPDFMAGCRGNTQTSCWPVRKVLT